MARGRMLSSTLGGSRKFSRLQTNDARLIYCLLLPHTDAYGRVEADPDYVKGTALSRIPITIDAVQAALEDMHNAGLIELYEVDGFQYAEFSDFAEHNRTYPSREAQTTIPAPDGNTPERPARDDPDTPQAKPSQDPDKTKARPRPENVSTKRKRKVNTEEVLNPPTPLQKTEPPPTKPPEATPRHQARKHKPPKFNPNTIPLPDFVSRDAWTDFTDHRHALKKPLTERATQLILKELAKTPLEADKMLRRSVANAWTGVYARNDERPPGKPTTEPTALDQYTERGL